MGAEPSFPRPAAVRGAEIGYPILMNEENIMKKRMTALLLLAVGSVLPAAGEVRLTRRIHVNSYYHEGVQRPERTTTVDLWIAPARMACLAGPARIIIDADRDLLILVNESTKTYAQAALSKPVSASMTPDDREAMPSTRRRRQSARPVRLGPSSGGSAKDTPSIFGPTWITPSRPGLRPMFRSIWRRTGFFSKKLYAFLERYDGASTEALLSVPGYILSEEDVADLKGETIRVNKDVIVIGEKTPPPGLFAVPEGYAKRPGLTHADVDLIASILE